MKSLGSWLSQRAMLACAMLALASFPLVVWAQGSTPTAAPTAQPAAPAPADTVRKVPAMSDSARAAFRAEVQRQLKQMADSLKITPAQRTTLRPILLDHAYQVKQLRDKYVAMERTPANREAMAKEMQTLRDATDAKLAAVLSGEQMAGYKKMRDEQLAKVRAKMGGGEAKPEGKK